jgi:transposase
MDSVNDDAKGGGYRRIEVLTGPERRRKWSADDKARIIAETLQPGAVVSEVARRWQVSPQLCFGVEEGPPWRVIGVQSGPL